MCNWAKLHKCESLPPPYLSAVDLQWQYQMARSGLEKRKLCWSVSGGGKASLICLRRCLVEDSLIEHSKDRWHIYHVKLKASTGYKTLQELTLIILFVCAETPKRSVRSKCGSGPRLRRWLEIYGRGHWSGDESDVQAASGHKKKRKARKKLRVREDTFPKGLASDCLLEACSCSIALNKTYLGSGMDRLWTKTRLKSCNVRRVSYADIVWTFFGHCQIRFGRVRDNHIVSEVFLFRQELPSHWSESAPCLKYVRTCPEYVQPKYKPIDTEVEAYLKQVCSKSEPVRPVSELCIA